MSRLTLEDIMDVREYERTRADFRTRVMATTSGPN